MRRQKYIDNRFIFRGLPFGTSVVSYLLFEQLKLTGVLAGVYIAIVGLYNLIVWVAAIVVIFRNNFAEPLFKQERK